jgi:hypothetical protein
VSEICDLLTDKAGQFSDLLVSESEALCTSQIVSVYFLGLAVSVLCLKVFFEIDDIQDLSYKKGVNAGASCYFLDSMSILKRAVDLK